MDINVYIIDRKSKQVIKTIDNPTGSDRPLCMKLFPGFDNEKMPYALLRDQDGVSVIDLKHSAAYKVF
jgi:hypothetical protein